MRNLRHMITGEMVQYSFHLKDDGNAIFVQHDLNSWDGLADLVSLKCDIDKNDLILAIRRSEPRSFVHNQRTFKLLQSETKVELVIVSLQATIPKWAFDAYEMFWIDRREPITTFDGIPHLALDCENHPVYSRQEYSDLWDLILKDYEEVKKTEHGGVVILGQSGIGNTCTYFSSSVLSYALTQGILYS